MIQTDQQARRLGNQAGFTLVELLVVMLILGLLAAIAIPSFFDQTDKAKDADAKAAVKTAQGAMEAFSTTKDGKYTGVTAAALHDIEPTLPEGAPLIITNIGPRTYTVTVTSTSGTDFSITRAVTGGVEYYCSVPESGGCPVGGDWG